MSSGQADVVKDSLDDEGSRDQGDETHRGIASWAAQDLRTPDPFHELRPCVMPRRSALLVLVEHLEVEHARLWRDRTISIRRIAPKLA